MKTIKQILVPVTPVFNVFWRYEEAESGDFRWMDKRPVHILALCVDGEGFDIIEGLRPENFGSKEEPIYFPSDEKNFVCICGADENDDELESVCASYREHWWKEQEAEKTLKSKA